MSLEELPPPSDIRPAEHRRRAIQEDYDEDCWSYGYVPHRFREHRRREIPNADKDLQLAATRVRDLGSGLGTYRGGNWGNNEDSPGDGAGAAEGAPQAEPKSKGRARQLNGGATGA